MFILADIPRIRGLQADDKTINQGSQYNCRIYMKMMFSSQRGRKCFCSWSPTWAPWRHMQTSNINSHDVSAAILVLQNNETAAMLVFQTNPVGVKLFSYVNVSFYCNKFA